MKKTILSIIMLTAGLTGMSAPLTPEAALDRAIDGAPQRVRSAVDGGMKLAETRQLDGKNTLYLFTPKKGTGYVAVAADDAVQALVGYGDTPLIDSKGRISPEFEYWLGEMSRQVNYAAGMEDSHKVIAMRERPYREPIAPLCETKWNQGDPYNFLCPKQGSETTYTGCVATAMAQVMKYHNWPEQATGSKSYSWNGKTLSLNFSKLKFQWDQMKNSYDGSETNKEKMIVGLLMEAAGYSVEMNYSTSGSGATSIQIAGALGTYFGYDKSIQYLYRDYYSLYDWEDMIYNSLKNDGPVIYDGQSTGGGHSFVCDGYDKDGYFHINWGWGGVSDGYFILDLLDPYTQGIGGSSNNSGFDYSQDIIFGIRPDTTGESTWTERMILYDGLNMEVGTETDDEGNEFDCLTYTGFVYNPGPSTIESGLLGISVAQLDEEDNIVGGMDFFYEIEGVGVGYGYERLPFDCLLQMRDDADYLVTMHFVGSDGVDQQVLGKLYDGSSARIHKENGEFTVVKETQELPATACQYQSTADISTFEFDIPTTFTNESDAAYYSLYTALLLDEDGNLIGTGDRRPLDLQPGETLNTEYRSGLSLSRGKELKAGDYYVVLCCMTSSYYRSLTAVAPIVLTDESGVEITPEEGSVQSGERYTLDGLRVRGAHRGVVIENGKLKIEN